MGSRNPDIHDVCFQSAVRNKRWRWAYEPVITIRGCPALDRFIQTYRESFVPIVQQKLVILIAWKGFPQLLQGPLRRRVFGDIEMKQTSGSDLQGNEYSLLPRWRGGCPMYFLTVWGESRIWSLSQSLSAIRSSPQVRFSAAIRRIKRLTSADTGGRPTGFDFQRQKRRNAARCQPINVTGLTTTKALRQSKKRASLDSTK